MRIWDVDRLENEMPVVMIAEWNEYMNWELATLTRAILGAVPAAKSIGAGEPDGNIHLTRPEDIGNFFDALNASKGKK